MFIAASEQETKKPKKIKKENILAGKKQNVLWNVIAGVVNCKLGN
jgi:hypothetical protein